MLFRVGWSDRYYLRNSVTLIGGSFKIFGLVVAGQFMCGFCAYPLLLQTYIYLFECCEDVYRQKITVAINYSWYIQNHSGAPPLPL